ncbi:ABC transporter ATP-binding protein [Chelatococcus sp. SYSU_G07232]|uniref:ABC transporter ATP-binding protein n=1 Tax=Chelatococcus albus TaxID=3047466 RepID=A0ABT7AIN7_9HYPH|nr:ABC transporter ATP-binding protein [Chelatococcus sp. SYSU_G07232]MDJ1159242.1 ABC transporter ATP-binding protein [Chelatococcus sp. SYSU_G07232]
MQLIADSITHAYGPLPVLKDISFTIAPGEVVAVVGPSGCGKSTLLRILGGLEQPSSGAALVKGAPPPGSLNPLTFVFQDFALLPWRTVAGNVRLALEGHGLAGKAAAAIVADTLARTGLADFADVYPKQLSGGMKQRVGIARALAVKPAVLLMDEPLSALDAQTRTLLMDDLVRLHAEGDLATVYVTHNLDEAVRLADRIVVLSRRPGSIKATFLLDMPRPARSAEDPALVREARRLWDLIRADAAEADRELADAEVADA